MSSRNLLPSFAVISAATALFWSVNQVGAAAAPVSPSTRDLVVQVCLGCHGPEILSQKGRTKDEWATVVQTMVERGALASDQEFQAIIDYLAQTYPPAARARPK
jgi:cytochrome c5